MKSTKSSKKKSATKKSTQTKKAKKSAAVKYHKRVHEAIQILSDLGLPEAQVNERTALTLLALLEMTKTKAWNDSGRPLLGVTEIIDYVSVHFKKTYAPNTRETFRRFSLHQLVQAELVKLNPDDQSRAINSPKNVYQISEELSKLVAGFGEGNWDTKVAAFSKKHGSLAEKIREERNVPTIEVKLPKGLRIKLSRGGQNPLIKLIIEDFCSRFVNKPSILYVGDAHKKNAFTDSKQLKTLGIELNEHGKAPDVVVYDSQRKWLLLFEAVTSHGPMNAKRKTELREIFGGSSAPLVFVTAFEDTKTFVKYAQDIAWETEVWIANNPTHMIHYNGEKFLGPYDTNQ